MWFCVVVIGELYLQDAAALARIEAKTGAIEAKTGAIEAKTGAIEAKMDGIVMMQNNLCTVSPVTFSAAVTQTRGTDWHFKVVSYYKHSQCMVLSQLYPNQAVPSWFRSDQEHCRVKNAFPAVAEHIIPKGQDTVGKSWNMDIWREYNGLLLLRHLERKYQMGQWSMLPILDGPDAGLFQIFVSDQCADENIMYLPTVGEGKHRVKGIVDGVADTPLRFSDLHGKKVQLIGKYAANPSLRALFLKAEMAHKVDDRLPHPSTRLQGFTARCEKMLMPNWQRWRASVPDAALPVLQDVLHQDEH